MKRPGTFAAARSALGCAVVLFCLAPLHAAEPAVREMLRRYLGQHQESGSKNEEPPPGFSLPVEQAIGLEYAVLLRKEELDEPVDPASYRFHAGNQIRVRIQPLNDLYIYVFFEDEQGSRRCLLPSDKNSPRLARHDQPVELPSDGSVFEFEAAADQQTLTIVATQKPDNDLTTLCDMVCKKREERLTPGERTLQAELKGKNQRALAAIEERQQKAAVFRGRLSVEALTRLSADMKQRGAEDALVEERPRDKQTTTMVALFSRSTAPPKLVVMIPLKASGASAASP